MEDDWRNNTAVVAIVDAVLLGLIRAHEPPVGVCLGGATARLAQAKKHLFGMPVRRGRRSDQDIPELIEMARLRLEEGGDFTFTRDYLVEFSDQAAHSAEAYQTGLARQALSNRKAREPGYQPHNEDEKIRNLQQKYADSEPELLRLVAGWSGSNSDLIRMHARDAAETLELLGIPFAQAVDEDRELNSPN